MRGALVGMITFLAGCSNYPPAAGDAPIDEGWQPANGAIVPPIDTAPRVSILERDATKFVVEITNLGTASLDYGARNASSISLCREVERNGKWMFDAMEWCGMGEDRLTIQPGQSIKVLLSFELPGKRERLLGSFTQTGTEKNSLVVLVFEPPEQY